MPTHTSPRRHERRSRHPTLPVPNEAAVGRGRDRPVSLLAFRCQEAGLTIANQLGIATADQVLVVERLHQPPECVIRLDETDVAENTLSKIAQERGLGAIRGERSLSAWPAPIDVATAFGLATPDHIPMSRARCRSATWVILVPPPSTPSSMARESRRRIQRNTLAETRSKAQERGHRRRRSCVLFGADPRKRARPSSPPTPPKLPCSAPTWRGADRSGTVRVARTDASRSRDRKICIRSSPAHPAPAPRRPPGDQVLTDQSAGVARRMHRRPTVGRDLSGLLVWAVRVIQSPSGFSFHPLQVVTSLHQ